MNTDAAFDAAVSGLSRRRRCLVGVSGGGDSVALLHLLLEAGFAGLHVCHLDHRLRGRASTADARFVRRLADKLGLPCDIARAEVRSAPGLSLETAARQARFAFFARVARERRCRTVLLGHHADDQAETVLFNLLRGSGLSGLSGMAASSEQRVGRITLQLVRPLLGHTRAELQAWLALRKIPCRTDASNTDVKHQRNNLRHRVLPELHRLTGRDPRPALLRLAALAAAEDELLVSLTPPATPELRVAELRSLPLALQRRQLATWLRLHRVPDIGFETIERVRAMLDPTRPARINLPGGSSARRRAGKLFLDPG